MLARRTTGKTAPEILLRDTSPRQREAARTLPPRIEVAFDGSDIRLRFPNNALNQFTWPGHGTWQVGSDEGGWVGWEDWKAFQSALGTVFTFDEDPAFQSDLTGRPEPLDVEVCPEIYESPWSGYRIHIVVHFGWPSEGHHLHIRFSDPEDVWAEFEREAMGTVGCEPLIRVAGSNVLAKRESIRTWRVDGGTYTYRSAGGATLSSGRGRRRGRGETQGEFTHYAWMVSDSAYFLSHKNADSTPRPDLIESLARHIPSILPDEYALAPDRLADLFAEESIREIEGRWDHQILKDLGDAAYTLGLRDIYADYLRPSPTFPARESARMYLARVRRRLQQVGESTDAEKRDAARRLSVILEGDTATPLPPATPWHDLWCQIPRAWEGMPLRSWMGLEPNENNPPPPDPGRFDVQRGIIDLATGWLGANRGNFRWIHGDRPPFPETGPRDLADALLLNERGHDCFGIWGCPNRLLLRGPDRYTAPAAGELPAPTVPPDIIAPRLYLAANVSDLDRLVRTPEDVPGLLRIDAGILFSLRDDDGPLLRETIPRYQESPCGLSRVGNLLLMHSGHQRLAGEELNGATRFSLTMLHRRTRELGDFAVTVWPGNAPAVETLERGGGPWTRWEFENRPVLAQFDESGAPERIAWQPARRAWATLDVWDPRFAACALRTYSGDDNRLDPE